MGAADMTKDSCIYGFISGFGPAAYEASAVPTGEDAPAFPYTTYSLPIGAFGEELSMTVSLWYRSFSWAEALAKASLHTAIERVLKTPEVPFSTTTLVLFRKSNQGHLSLKMSLVF